MEVNPSQFTEPELANDQQEDTEAQRTMAQLFYRMVQKVMDQATENSNSGA